MRLCWTAERTGIVPATPMIPLGKSVPTTLRNHDMAEMANGIYGDPFGGGDFGLETAQYCKITEKK